MSHQIYIANCSKSDFLFTYMLVENPRPFHHKIRAGSQICLNLDKSETDQIIKQHSIYGMQPVDNVTKGFSGLAYAFKPISVEAIQAGISQKDQENIERALETRKNTAAATDHILQEKAREFGSRQTAPLEIEVIEEKRNPIDEGTGFNETITVVKQGLDPDKGRNKRGRAA